MFAIKSYKHSNFLLKILSTTLSPQVTYVGTEMSQMCLYITTNMYVCTYALKLTMYTQCRLQNKIFLCNFFLSVGIMQHDESLDLSIHICMYVCNTLPDITAFKGPFEHCAVKNRGINQLTLFIPQLHQVVWI